MHRSVAARYTMALTVPTITTVPSSFSIQMEPLARLVPLSVDLVGYDNIGRHYVVGPDYVGELDVQDAALEPASAEISIHQVTDVGHGHAASHDDLLESELFGRAPVGVVVGVAVEEHAAHFEANPVWVALDEVSLGYREAPGASLGPGVAQRDLAGRLTQQVALVVIADGHGLAVRRPQYDLGVHERAVAVLVDVHDPRIGLIAPSGSYGSVHRPLLAHPEVAEGVLEAAAEEAAVHGG